MENKPQHLGSKSIVADGSSIDLDEIIAKNPCNSAYAMLEDCLVETNRSWQKCQVHVRVLFIVINVTVSFSSNNVASCHVYFSQVKRLKDCAEQAKQKGGTAGKG